ncbi:HAMP domain-containing sensor histidine kinase [Polymorphospora sp. NPDC050346]|uniref:sensor histidine kinase n=1 Tax=Polymorphospora sp. NPDC050346 TaxID=3155780 RepID=UPI0033F1C6C4
MDQERTPAGGGRPDGEATGGTTGRPEAVGPAAGRVPAPRTAAARRRAAAADAGRRQLSHDIHHQIGTISLLATLLGEAADVGPHSRARAGLILREVERLDRLQRAYDDCPPAEGPAAPVRLDLVAAEVVEAIAPATTTRVRVRARELTAYADRLAYWRVLRNVVQNAVRAAGPRGLVEVTLAVEDGWAVTRVDDDGPGLNAAAARTGGLGLSIVRDLTAGWGGGVRIESGPLGGGRVVLLTPAHAAAARENNREGAVR